MTTQPSPLGRYNMSDGSDAVEVHLLGTPLDLLVRAREHHDELVREFRLLALSGQVAAPDTPLRLVELTEILGREHSAAGSRHDQDVDQALANGELRRDLHYSVGAGGLEAVRGLEALMVEADGFCAAEQLMTLERPALLRRFASWHLGQFVSQYAGGPAVPWDGPLTLEQG